MGRKAMEGKRDSERVMKGSQNSEGMMKVTEGRSGRRDSDCVAREADEG